MQQCCTNSLVLKFDFERGLKEIVDKKNGFNFAYQQNQTHTL